MAKEFSEWLSSMANSIEDASYVNNFIGDHLNALQRRMLIADTLVFCPLNEKEIDDWVTAFCVSLDKSGDVGERSLISLSLKGLIGEQQVALYVASSGDEESRQWLNNLRKQIRHNTLRRD